MREEKILLQWLSSPEGYETVLTEETRKQYDLKTGPLWRVTVMPTLESSLFDSDDSFLCVYRVLFGLQHTITDGHSSMRMCGYFLSLLDSVIEGITIDDNKQFASYIGPEYHEKLLTEAYGILQTNPDFARKLRDDYNAQAAVGSLLTKVFPPTTEHHPETLTLFTELDEGVTSKIITKSKSERVSVHSGFCSVIQCALIEMFQEAGLSTDTYEMISYHDVNERRYWGCEADNFFGPHVDMLRILFPVGKNIHSNFWDSARMFQSAFRERVDNKQIIYNVILDSETLPPVKKSSELYKYKMPCPRVYSTSNMGDVTKLFLKPDGSEHSHVKAIQIRRSTTLHSYKTNNAFVFQTFRGKLTFSFDYNTRYISSELARRIVDKVLIHLRYHAA
ncbi:Alcohol acetyltransferase/N-acetyltransferase [Trinorchestia longiramus]|nr:Alcohol acetyltransferase/N-acetyltransferase [Trinorchestia longiramus]